MARLPKIGGDSGTWGEVLNDFLAESHNDDGTLRGDTVGAAQLAPNAVMTPAIGNGQVTGAKIADGSVSSSKVADGAIGTDQIADGTITTAKLDGLGDADGIASLDSDGQLPETQVPERLSEAQLSAKMGDLAGVTVSIVDYPDLKSAIADLPADGGTVMIPNGRYPSGDFTYDTDYMAKPNVRLVGESAPRISATADRLEGGAIIYGRFNVFADGFEVERVGFDMGKHVIDTFYGGVDTHTANHPLGGTWDAFAFAQPNIVTPLTNRRGVLIRDVVGLLRDSQSVGHGVLIEGITGGTVDDVIGIGGVHGVVIKSTHLTIGTLRGWAASNENIIIKSDTYAPAGNLKIGHLESLTQIPGVTPWFAPAIATFGVLFNPVANFPGPVEIGSIRVFGAGRGVAFDGGAIVEDVHIGHVYVNGYTGATSHGIIRTSTRALRVTIDEVSVLTATVGIDWSAGAFDHYHGELRVGAGNFAAMGVRAVQATDFGRVSFKSVSIVDSNALFYVGDDALVTTGVLERSATPTLWESKPPQLAVGWTQFGGGNSTFEVLPTANGASLKGLVLAGATATGVIATLPPYLRPTESLRFPAYRNTSASRYFAMVNVSTNGEVSIDDGTAPASGSYISLDGISWSL